MIVASLQRDLRFAVRSLSRRPGFLITVVLTLALGLGVNAAIFTVFHHVLMKPLPVPEPERLVNLEAPGPRSGWSTSDSSGSSRAIVSYPMFRDLEAAQGEGIRLAGHRSSAMNMTWQANTSSVQGHLVSGSYFSVLGLTPGIGRLLTAQDDAVPGQAEAVVLSHAFWQDRFGGDPSVLGQVLRLNGLPMTVVGVAPAGFTGTTLGLRSDVFVPISVRWPDRPDSLPEHEQRDRFWVYLFGRLAPGATLASATLPLQSRYSAVLNDIEAPLQQGFSERAMAEFKAKQLVFTPGAHGQSRLPESLSTPLLTLLLVSALVLLIACVNIANLQLARGALRANEMAVRSAIGAGAGRLRRQLLAESCLLALLGALCALPLAWLVSRGLAALDSTGTAALAAGALPLTTVLFTFATALATVLLFGLFPAWQLSRAAPADALRTRSGQPGGDRASGRFRNGLAIVQIAFSLALLVLAGLFARSLDNIARTDLGMDVERVLTFSVSPELNGYGPERSQRLFERIEDDLAALPGVSAVALSSMTLLANNDWASSVSVQGYEPAPDEATNSSLNDIGPGYFDTLGIPLLAGREFSRQDGATSPKVAIVNRRFTERYQLGDDAIGKRLALSTGNPELDIEIVGVVADSAYSQVKGEIPPLLYLPTRQSTNLGSLNVYVRSATQTSTLAPLLQQAVNRIDPNVPVLALRGFDEQIRQNTGTDRLVGVLSAGFAALATLLAAIGLYGLLAYAVAQRTREMGLRLALGAPPARVRGLILKQIGRLAAIGLALGLVLAIGLGTAARSMLFGLSGYDPLVLLAATLLLALVVLAAAWWPAWRASRTDPMTALRDE